MLQRAGIEARHFAAILGRLEASASKGGVFPGFLSSHPPTAEREALVRSTPGRVGSEGADGPTSK
jgi:predicted Zn-dependent protease